MRTLLLSVIMLVPVLVFANDVPEAADAAAGKAIYSQTCIACHGANGKGAIPGVWSISQATLRPVLVVVAAINWMMT